MSNEQSDSEAAIRQIEFLAAVHTGEEQADRGEVITLEQLEKTLRTAISKCLD